VTPERAQRLFIDQCLDDVEAAVYRLFERIPTLDLDVIDARVFQRGGEKPILAASVSRRAAAWALPRAGEVGIARA
jgi:hypothetical protein